MSQHLSNVLNAIQPVDRSLAPKLQARLDNLTKPPGSLGRLEELALRYGLARNTDDPHVNRPRIYTLAADHGVAAEGVSAYPACVTVQMVHNLLAQGAGVNVLARHAGGEVRVVDIGVNDPLDGAEGLLRHKVAPGTANMAQGPAMIEAQCHQALEVGFALAQQAEQEGVTLLGTGEMGIANTTAAAALMAALLPCDVRDAAGVGTGIDAATLDHKRQVIQRALQVNADCLFDPIGALAAVGGLEIAGLCGLILGGAARRIPTVVDGFISTSAALVAWRLCPAVKDYLFFSHLSAEAGHATFFRHLGDRPLLDLQFRLGEGTGAALAMDLIQAGLKIYHEMATFDQAGVESRKVGQ